MTEKLQEIVISKESAVFWLDGNGCWHNKYGKFRRKKIIDFFNSSIRKDKNGYYVSQTRDQFKEKVYFNYEDTALFVFDVIKDKDIILVLNTMKKTILRPEKLYIKDDGLYMRYGEEQIKFTDKGLLRISDIIEYNNNQYDIRVNNRKYKINQISSGA